MSSNDIKSETISGRLRAARNKLELTQQTAADSFGVPFSTYKRYEGGINDPNKNVLEGLVRLGINVNWLLTGSGEMLLITSNQIDENKLQIKISNAASSTNDVSEAEVESNRVDTIYAANLQICLAACKKLYGEEFNKMNDNMQQMYSEDLHEKLQDYFKIFWRFYNTYKRFSSYCSLDLLGEDGVFYELQNLRKLGAVMPFPYNHFEQMIKF
jgi:transcriptional regulator with XRE-family HTH domain